MKTLVLKEPGQLELADSPAPEHPSPRGALVRVHRVGICGTDLHAYRGRQPFFSYPRILGHELGVEILALGEDAAQFGLVPGDRCAVRPYLNCGICAACRRGVVNACINLRVLGVHSDGGMQELIQLPASHLHKANDLGYEQLALVEMLSIGAHAVRRAALSAGETALVIGLGPIGLATAVFAKHAGARVIGLDIQAGRLDFARTTVGIESIIDGREDVRAQLESLVPGDLPTAVFDATGNAGSMQRSFAYVAHGGQLVFVGLHQGDVTFSDPDFHRREVTLKASRNATAEDFGQVLALLRSGTLSTDPWITHRAGLEETPDDFPAWTGENSGVIKAMLVIA